MTPEEIEKKVRERVVESPDNIYAQAERAFKCAYTVGECSDGTTGCIFGQVLPRNFIDKVERVEEDEEGIYVETASVSGVLSEMEIYDPDFCNWCNIIQSSQDIGMTWIQSLNKADEWREMLKIKSGTKLDIGTVKSILNDGVLLESGHIVSFKGCSESYERSLR